MGGHGNVHWHCPDWRSYKVSNSKDVKQHVERLAKLGLKDPWARILFGGFPQGVLAGFILIGVEELLGYSSGSLLDDTIEKLQSKH